VLGLVFLLGVLVAAEGPPSPRSVPFHPGALTGVGANGKPQTVTERGARILLYLREDCPFCQEELSRWADVLGPTGEAPVLAVLAPGSKEDYPSHLPTALRRRWMRDPGGDIARRLGVTAVPTLTVLDHRGAVIELHVGLSLPARIRRLLDEATTPSPLTGR